MGVLLRLFGCFALKFLRMCTHVSDVAGAFEELTKLGLFHSDASGFDLDLVVGDVLVEGDVLAAPWFRLRRAGAPGCSAEIWIVVRRRVRGAAQTLATEREDALALGGTGVAAALGSSAAQELRLAEH